MFGRRKAIREYQRSYDAFAASLLAQVREMVANRDHFEAMTDDLVGESYRMDNLRALMRGVQPDRNGWQTRPCILKLIFEPDNPVDPRAVAGFIDGSHVGYVAASETGWYHRHRHSTVLKWGWPFPAVINGREDTYGVKFARETLDIE